MMPHAHFDRLDGLRLVGLLPENIPLQQIIPLADSLLASPIEAVLVAVRTERGGQLIADLRERSGRHMFVGAFLGDQAADPGPAQFLAGRPPSGQSSLLFIPWESDLDARSQENYPFLLVQAQEAALHRAGARYPQTPLWAVLDENHPIELLPKLRTAGAAACVLPLWHGPDQTMAATITLARTATRLLAADS